MKYRNHAVRCAHGFCRDVVPCPTCDEPVRGKRYERKDYEPSVGKRPHVRSFRGQAPTPEGAPSYQRRGGA